VPGRGLRKRALNCGIQPHLPGYTREGEPRVTSSVHTFIEGMVTHVRTQQMREGSSEEASPTESEEESSPVVASREHSGPQ
jgi:hypothetical protein